MRKLLSLGILLGALIATSAFATDWQDVWKGDRKSGGTWAVSIDKQSLKRMSGSKVRVSIREQFSEAQEYTKGGSTLFEYDMAIYDWVISCGDYTSTVMQRTYYQNSTIVKDFTGPFDPFPAPPQFETGIPPAMRLACSSAGN
jgi:hypothetical protein